MIPNNFESLTEIELEQLLDRQKLPKHIAIIMFTSFTDDFVLRFASLSLKQALRWFSAMAMVAGQKNDIYRALKDIKLP